MARLRRRGRVENDAARWEPPSWLGAAKHFAVCPTARRLVAQPSSAPRRPKPFSGNPFERCCTNARDVTACVWPGLRSDVCRLQPPPYFCKSPDWRFSEGGEDEERNCGRGGPRRHTYAGASRSIG